MPSTATARVLCLLALNLLLGACGGSVDVRPGGGETPDAVPRSEPLSRYGNPTSYVVKGRRYYTLKSAQGYRDRGIASWYGHPFHGRRTSSGETYDMNLMTAAHKSLPLPTYVEVTNLQNGKRVVLRVNDRGPFHDNRLIDLSYAAARKLGIWQSGTGLVEVRALDAAAPASPPAAAPTVVASGAAPRIYLQVGAFSVQANAQALAGRIDRVAEVPVILSEAERLGRPVWRVRLGPLSDVAQADQITGLLLSRGFEAPHVVID